MIYTFFNTIYILYSLYKLYIKKKIKPPVITNITFNYLTATKNIFNQLRLKHLQVI